MDRLFRGVQRQLSNLHQRVQLARTDSGQAAVDQFETPPAAPAASWPAAPRPATPLRDSEALRVHSLRYKLAHAAANLPVWTRDVDVTEALAADLAASVRDDHALPLAFHHLCALRVVDRAFGRDGWTGAPLDRRDFSRADVVALAHAVGGEAFGEAVRAIRQEPDRRVAPGFRAPADLVPYLRGLE